MLQDTPDEMFKYMIQCITDSVNSKYNDVNTATVCQVCLSVCSCMSDVRLFVFCFFQVRQLLSIVHVIRYISKSFNDS